MKIFNPLLKCHRTTGKKFFFYSAFAAGLILQSSQKSFAQVSLTTPGTPYTQDFNTLINTAGSTTNTLTIPGWSLTETGGGARDNEQYAVDNGASTTGDTYSYGTAASTDRSIGGLRSGTLIPNFGASFTNNTGAAITSLDLSYTGEEWRCGTAGRTDALNFEYSLNATSLTTGTWINVSTLNFITPVTTSVGAKDGNAAANRTALLATIGALSIPNGATFWIRWTDIDATGADDGLAVDDFSLTPSTAVAAAPEMNVFGNSVSIFNNDVTPSTADFTDFGAISVCSSTINRTFTISNTGTSDLTFSNVTVSGANASDFTVSAQPVSPVTAAGSTTFIVTFDPSASGTRTATLNIVNNDSDENPYTFSIQGMGFSVAAIIFSHTNVSCFGGSNGSAAISAGGGTPPYTYSWMPSGGTATTASGLTANTYTCTVTDSTGCTTTDAVTITEPPVITSTISTQTNVSCFGGSNGSATVSASGGTPSYTYSWAPSGGTAATASGLTANTYTCTITDANGCTATQTATITEPPVITSTISAQTNVSCFGGSNGTVTVSASGGTPSYTYSWAPSGGTAATASSLTANTYTCIITDANGCTATQTATITEPPVITSTISAQTNVSCFGGSNGTATVSASGGTPSYTYSWAPSGGTAATASGLAANTYTCTITDANGCTATQTATITAPTAITSTIASQTNVSCFGGSNGSASVNAGGGTPSYTYSWAPSGGTAATISGAGANTYTCTITDNNGCTSTATVTITQPLELMAMSSAASLICNGDTANVTVSAMDGTSPYTGTGTFRKAAGTSIYTVTDANGCTATTSITIAQPAAISSSQTMTLCAGGSVTVGTNVHTTSGIFTDVLTSMNGCDSTITTNLTINNIITGSQTMVLCAGDSLTIGTTTYHSSGTYSDTLTAMNGCDSILSTNLTINPAIDISTSLSGQVITANFAGATSYQWIDCDNSNAPLSGETGQSYTATADGDFAVVITAGSCSDTSACVNITGTGISHADAGPELNIYPNPANDLITVQLQNSSFSKTTIIFLYDAMGKLISKTQVSSLTTEIGLAQLPKGIYFIKLQNGNGVITKKITKQ